MVGLTGARYAGHANLPGIDMFGADGGVSGLAMFEMMVMRNVADRVLNPMLIRIVHLAIRIKRRDELALMQRSLGRTALSRALEWSTALVRVCGDASPVLRLRLDVIS